MSNKITVDQIATFVGALPAGQTIMLWSPHGIDVGSAVQRFADERNVKVSHVRLSAIDPANPVIPSACIPTESNSILFLDEIDVAPPEVQTLAHQIIVNHVVGSQPLPAGCRVVCAGGFSVRTGMNCAVPAPLANKMVHLVVEADIVSWRKWAYGAGIDTRIISFLSIKPDLLYAISTQNSSGAWPSPRSWAAVNRILTSNLTPADIDTAIAGCVGVDVAKEFARHRDDFRHYTKRMLGILDGVESDYVESNPPCAISVAIAVVASATNDIKTLTNILDWAKKQHPEYTAVVMRGLEERFGKTLPL